MSVFVKLLNMLPFKINIPKHNSNFPTKTPTGGNQNYKVYTVALFITGQVTESLVNLKFYFQGRATAQCE